MDTGLLFALLLCINAAFWASYLRPRVGIEKKQRHASVKFLANLCWSLTLLTFAQCAVLKAYNVLNALTGVNIILMSLAFIIHHSSILIKTKVSSRKLDKVHHQVSHTLFFIPYGLNSAIFCMAALRTVEPVSISGLLILVFLAYSISVSVLGILVGIKKIKLNY